MRPAKFLEAFSNWSKSNFHENRGRKRLKLETKQIIYDEWISNSVPPVDCRNDRECMKIKKNISMQIYNKLENETPLIEKMNKRGILQYTATRRVATCTLRKLQSKSASKYDIEMSIRSVFALKLFYVTVLFLIHWWLQ